jgi:hypothetical protein
VACFAGKTLLSFSLILSFLCLLLADQHSLVSICWRQELEHRARDKYGTFDQMSAELASSGSSVTPSTPSRRP